MFLSSIKSLWQCIWVQMVKYFLCSSSFSFERVVITSHYHILTVPVFNISFLEIGVILSKARKQFQVLLTFMITFIFVKTVVSTFCAIFPCVCLIAWKIIKLWKMWHLYVLKSKPFMYENKPDKWTLNTRTIKKRLRMSAFYRSNNTVYQTL